MTNKNKLPGGLSYFAGKILRNKFVAVLLCTLSLSLTSCMEEDIIVPANTSFPFGYIDYTDTALFALANLQSTIEPNKEGVWSVFYEDTVEAISPEDLDSLFKMDVQNVAFTVETGFALPGGEMPSTLYELTEPLLVKVIIKGLEEGERIDLLTFEDCTVRLNVNNAPAGSDFSEANWEIVEMTEATTPAPKRFANTDYNIAGCTIKPSHETNNEGDSVHTITIRITGKVPAMEIFTGNIVMNPKKIRTMTGNVGKKVIKIENSEFEFGDKLTNLSNQIEEAFFANPVLTFHYNNTFDVPVLLTIDEVLINENTIRLSNDIAKTTIEIMPKTQGVFVFDNSNTIDNDLSKNITLDAKTVTLSTTATTNSVANNETMLPNVITNQDKLDVIYRVDLPLEGYVRGLQFEQTYNDVKLEVEDVNWQEMTFAFTGTNSILMDFDVDLYSFNEAGLPVLLTQQPARVPSAISETEPVTVLKEESYIVLNKQQVDAINRQQKLMIRYKASTKDIANKSIIRLLTNTGLNLNLLVGAKAEISN